MIKLSSYNNMRFNILIIISKQTKTTPANKKKKKSKFSNKKRDSNPCAAKGVLSKNNYIV